MDYKNKLRAINNEKDVNKANILVIDNDKTIRHLIGSILLYGGYEVTIAVNVKDAIDHCKKQSPDVIITDFKTSDVDGLKLAKKIQHAEDSTYIPFIFIVSSFSEAASIIEVKDIGLHDYLTHPIDHEELILKVRLMLKNKKICNTLMNK